jgi:hypothetical protein
MAMQSIAIEPSEQRPLGLVSPTDMSDGELLDHLQTNLFGPLKRRLRDHLPYLMEARERFAQPGRRVPVKGNPTWTEFCEQELGVGVRNVQKLLADGKKPRTETKKKRKQYDAVDIAHLEKVARAAQQVAEADPDNAEYEPIREAIADKPVLTSPGEAPTKPDPVVPQEFEEAIREQEAANQEMEERIALMTAEHKQIVGNLQRRLKALMDVPEHLRDENITAALASEPDCGIASALLTAYLHSIVDRILPPSMPLRKVSAEVEIVGRDKRIMIGDFVEKRNREQKDTHASILCKCTAIGECESRRRVREWVDGKWDKEHVVYGNEERHYRVITEAAARLLEPGAFAEAKAQIAKPTTPETRVEEPTKEEL